MQILLINGSPKGKRSNSLKLANSFIEGLKQKKEENGEQVTELLYPKEVFEEMADASWGISRESGEKEPYDLIFTRQMAALYNKGAYDGKDRVLEMHYTDLGNTYQILLGKDGSKVYTDGSLMATTHIDTAFEVWSAISRGEMGGAEALGNGMYTVSGDFSLMIDWDRFFGSTKAQAAEEDKTKPGEMGLKKPSMTTMLIPWITFWIAVSFSADIGAVITMAVCALVPVAMGIFTVWFEKWYPAWLAGGKGKR